jgi:hypothetical protein
MPNKLILTLIFLFWGHILEAKNYELYIVAGQSNAQGWKGDAAKYPKDKVDKTIPFFYNSPKIGSSKGEWTTLGPQEGRLPKGHFGPEISFARAFKKNDLDMAIFKFTLGATSLAGRWKAPGAGGLYDQMVVEYKKAITAMKKQGHKVTVKGFIWIQGESDAQSPKANKAYLKNLSTLINDLERVVGNRDFKIILGVDEQHSKIVKFPGIVEAHQAFVKKNPKRAIFTSMLGLKKADSTHLLPESLKEHGERLFDAYVKISK